MPFWQDIFAHDCIPNSGKLLELGCGAGNLTATY
jgi:16S rRNA A1518/A1519 N6-dimethyltransferase RsmA/KsgA/DIM1 with predicted DNA glycosylase/AP lyase activity